MSNLRRHTDRQLDAERASCEGTRIDLDAFLALAPEAKAARWRQWDAAAKADVVIQRLNAKQLGWDNATVAGYIAKYDARYALGPVEAAIEGALERLALEHASAARLADQAGDLAHRKAERAAATAFTNALREYRKGVRAALLPSGNWLLPSSSGGRAHIITMDGDFVCNCEAGANIHWPIALVIAIEVAHDAMSETDDGAPESVLEHRIAITNETLDAMRMSQRLCKAGRFSYAA